MALVGEQSLSTNLGTIYRLVSTLPFLEVTATGPVCSQDVETELQKKV